MFEKYNEKARRALFFARYEASKLGSRVIESEHVLLGILREGEESVNELFQRFEVRPEEIRREIEGERVFVERISSTAELPLSEESKKILAYASHEAESMLHSSVGSEHLLIGILRVESSLAARILKQQGVEMVANRLIGQAIKTVADSILPPVERAAGSGGEDDTGAYADILAWFAAGNELELSDEQPFTEYSAELARVPGLMELVGEMAGGAEGQALLAELVLEVRGET